MYSQILPVCLKCLSFNAVENECMWRPDYVFFPQKAESRLGGAVRNCALISDNNKPLISNYNIFLQILLDVDIKICLHFSFPVDVL